MTSKKFHISYRFLVITALILAGIIVLITILTKPESFIIPRYEF